jgi:hypothetical protein
MFFFPKEFLLLAEQLLEQLPQKSANGFFTLTERKCF